MSEIAFEFKNVTKKFGDLTANEDLSFQVPKGCIFGLVGENGAGKSTAMKVLYGQEKPTSGSISVFGGAVNFKSPFDAIRFGIGMVHQHFMLAEPHTVLDNIILGSEMISAGPIEKILPRTFRKIDRFKSEKKIREILENYGFDIPLHETIENLPLGIQQRIEIIKLLYRDASILILDEPTAVLTPQETNDLFENLRTLKAQGKTIVIITHKLKEILEITDFVAVLRQGKKVGERVTAETSQEDLAQLMVGRNLDLSVKPDMSQSKGEIVLNVSNLSTLVGKRLKGLNFFVRSGEVLGVAGVEGNGQSELLDALFNPKRIESGTIEILGKSTSGLSSNEIKDWGVGYVPQDRQTQGLVLSESLKDNFLLGHQTRKEFIKFGIVIESSVKLIAQKALDDYDVRPNLLETSVSNLSGGNQQKLIIAREMAFDPKLLIIAQPTRGVDIGAIEHIHNEIRKAKKRGMAILLISSELDEILALSNRVMVMFEGRGVATFDRDECDVTKLGLSMGGGVSANPNC